MTALANRVRWSNLTAGLALGIAIAGFAIVHWLANNSLTGFAVVTLVTELVPALVVVKIGFRVTGGSSRGISLLSRALIANSPLLLLVVIPEIVEGPLGLGIAALSALGGLVLGFSLIFPRVLEESWRLVVDSFREVTRGLKAMTSRTGGD